MVTRFFGSVLVALLVSLASSAAQARDVVIFAPASLKNVLDTALALYEERSGTQVVVSYAGSSALARQIQHGAPADIFISANEAWMDQLQDQALIAADTRRVLAGNRLVLIGTTDGQLPLATDSVLAALGSEGRLAMALVEAVPAGIYGKAALTNLGLWDALAPHIAQTDNVRAALRLVSLQEAPLGIVYDTDARLDDTVFIRATFDLDTHPPILYPAARVADSRAPQADDVLAFLSSEPGQAIFSDYGFLPGNSE